MEDILEEIVGNILDEYDVDEHFIQEIDGSTWLMKGLTELSEVEEVLNIEFDDDFETLNGFLISRLEHIPGKMRLPALITGDTISRLSEWTIILLPWSG